MSLFYQPQNAWVGDLIPYYEDGTFYAYYLHDPRMLPDKYAEETTWHLVTTEDFVNVTYHGEAIKRGTIEDYNYNIYTGSVIKDQNGKYHAFYTGYNEHKQFFEGKSVQVVMKASGDSPYDLKTDKDFIFSSDGNIYEEFDWRDPFVFWVEEEQCYYMLLASRRQNAGELRGCISLSKSKDLINWEYCQPFYDPKMYVTMECPEVFKMGEYWYLVFSTFSDRFTTHYRYSKSLEGPWIIPNDDVLDTRADYAIKTATDGERRIAFGWIASKKDGNDFGSWDWGGTMVFNEIKQCSKTGEIKMVMPKEIGSYYQNSVKVKNESRYNNSSLAANTVISETLGATLYDCPYENFSANLSFTVESAKEFGVALHVDEGLEKGYYLRMMPYHHLVAWDYWPRAEKGEYQWQIKGDIPYQIETSRILPENDTYDVKIIREKDLCVVYINDEIVLSNRLYNHKEGKIGIYVIQGELYLNEFNISE